MKLLTFIFVFLAMVALMAMAASQLIGLKPYTPKLKVGDCLIHQVIETPSEAWEQPVKETIEIKIIQIGKNNYGVCYLSHRGCMTDNIYSQEFKWTDDTFTKEACK